MAFTTWDGGGGDGLWSNPLNWSSDVLPTAVDDVTINVLDAQRTIFADAGSIRVRSLNVFETLVVNRGTAVGADFITLADSAQLRVSGTVDWAGGTWSSAAPARIQPGGVLNIGRAATPTSGGIGINTAIENNGRVNWRGGYIQLGGLGSITNLTGRVFDIAAPSSIGASTGARITNHGVIRHTGAEDTITQIRAFTLENFGRISVPRGQLQVIATELVNNGRIQAAGPTALVTLESPGATHQNATFEGTGRFVFDGSRHEFDGVLLRADAVVDAYTTVDVGENGLTISGSTLHEGGTLTGAGRIGVAGELTILNGTIGAPIDVLAGGTLNLGTPTSSPLGAIYLGSTINNAGSTLFTAGRLRLPVTGSIVNLPTGRFTASGNAAGIYASYAPGSIQNRGTMTVDRGSKSFTVSVDLDNRGTLDVRSGQVLLTGDVEQLTFLTPTSDALTGGTWILRDNAFLDMPGDTSITLLGKGASVQLDGSEAQFDDLDSLAENRGRITLSGGRSRFETLATSAQGDPTLINKGLIRKIGAGTTTLGMRIDQRSSPGSNPEIEVKGGTLRIRGDAFANPGTLDIQKGRLVIELAPGGDLTNTGRIKLGATGELKVVGDFVSSTGDVVCSIKSASFGRLTATGDTAFGGGSLRANLSGAGFAAGQSRLVISASPYFGSFGSVIVVGLPSSLEARALYGASGVSVLIVDA